MNRKNRLIHNFPKQYPIRKKIYANILFFLGTRKIKRRKFSLNKKDKNIIKRRVQKGDIILFGNLKYLSSKILGDSITHSTIYIGNKKIIHAVAGGVAKTPLKQALETYDTAAILRIKRKPPRGRKRGNMATLKKQEERKIIKNAIDYAKMQIGKPYDFEFKDDNSKFFCTELVNGAYKHAGFKTGLKTIKKKKPLLAKDLVKGNFKIIFMSHNLTYKDKEIVHNDKKTRKRKKWI